MTQENGYKGFDKNFKCRDMQYEPGKEYQVDENKLKCCNHGLHYCENPLDVFGYYPPSDSRYAEVENRGKTDRDGQDSKVASSRLFIKAEVTLIKLIQASVSFILSKVDFKNAPATNTGDQSAATNTGYQSAATNTGDQSAATVEGAESVAMCIGIEGKARGKKGCWIVLSEWKKNKDYSWTRKSVKAFEVYGKKVKADTFYTLKAGKLKEVKD